MKRYWFIEKGETVNGQLCAGKRRLSMLVELSDKGVANYWHRDNPFSKMFQTDTASLLKKQTIEECLKTNTPALDVKCVLIVSYEICATYGKITDWTEIGDVKQVKKFEDVPVQRKITVVDGIIVGIVHDTTKD